MIIIIVMIIIIIIIIITLATVLQCGFSHSSPLCGFHCNSSDNGGWVSLITPTICWRHWFCICYVGCKKAYLRLAICATSLSWSKNNLRRFFSFLTEIWQWKWHWQWNKTIWKVHWSILIILDVVIILELSSPLMGLFRGNEQMI